MPVGSLAVSGFTKIFSPIVNQGKPRTNLRLFAYAYVRGCVKKPGDIALLRRTAALKLSFHCQQTL